MNEKIVLVDLKGERKKKGEKEKRTESSLAISWILFILFKDNALETEIF